MNIALLLQIAADAAPDRIALGALDDGLTYERLLAESRGAGLALEEAGVARLLHTAESSPALPVCLFGAAFAGVPFVPLNYRLADDRLRNLVQRQAPAWLVVDAGTEHRFEDIDGITVLTTTELLAIASKTAAARDDETSVDLGEGDGVAVLLHTSGTSSEPKGAVLRHRHLSNYVIGSVEVLDASTDDATLASVPPYHIAAVSGILTAVFSGRRLVQLAAFDPHRWVAMARAERITHAMTVPTMLARILDVLDPATGGDGLGLPSVRHLSYGGGRMPLPIIERALRLLPGVDFVNAYGLTETSSSIAVLTPQDHRDALQSSDPAVRARLASVGKPLPTVEIEIRDDAGRAVPPGVDGEIWVRGDQVSGEYQHQGGRSDGWFATNDGGHFDDEGFLFVTGRLDDVIVRGGENLSPGEIEDVLLLHPSVREAAVVGVPDTEWGEAVGAAVVPHDGEHPSMSDLQDWVVLHLRSSRRPSIVDVRDHLPQTDTGKVLRRVIRDELAARIAHLS